MRKLKDILPALLWAITLVGVLTVFRACGAKEDGSFMNCHNAQVAGAVVAAVGAAGNLAGLLVKKRVGTIAGLALNAVCALAIMILPQNVIRLCMMPEMRCRAWMRPWLLVMGAVILIAAVATAIPTLKRKR